MQAPNWEKNNKNKFLDILILILCRQVEVITGNLTQDWSYDQSHIVSLGGELLDVALL